ncbi:MAG TPA: Crp/Fnr family transcriptional regulator [Vicinamibacteria bacterium]|nr:Crp/Fnr family transcriptional regulator [Vicinamibacteria bacterium]
MATVEDLLRSSTLYRNLSAEDQRRLAQVSLARSYGRGDTIFSEGDPPDFLVTIADGRVKVVKMVPSGKEIILEIFGPGDPVGAVVAYEGRPYPASAIALEPCSCILVRRSEFFALLERHPSFVRGFLSGMALRIVELTRRIPEVAGGRVETRFAHLFLKLAERVGQRRPEGRFVPMPLSRQELAELTGTTTETCIRIMSRWGKEGVVSTERDGFLVRDEETLQRLAGA